MLGSEVPSFNFTERRKIMEDEYDTPNIIEEEPSESWDKKHSTKLG